MNPKGLFVFAEAVVGRSFNGIADAEPVKLFCKWGTMVRSRG